jgi:hypothetical protein
MRAYARSRWRTAIQALLAAVLADQRATLPAPHSVLKARPAFAGLAMVATPELKKFRSSYRQTLDRITIDPPLYH